MRVISGLIPGEVYQFPANKWLHRQSVWGNCEFIGMEMEVTGILDELSMEG
jgi:hypothetical protein